MRIARRTGILLAALSVASSAMAWGPLPARFGARRVENVATAPVQAPALDPLAAWRFDSGPREVTAVDSTARRAQVEAALVAQTYRLGTGGAVAVVDEERAQFGPSPRGIVAVVGYDDGEEGIPVQPRQGKRVAAVIDSATAERP